MARRCQALSRKLCSIYAGRPRDASVGLPPTMNVHNNIPSSGVTRQAAQRCARGARLREARGPDVTKRANRGWARGGKTVQLASLTSSYSSLQGADRDSGESVIQGPHGGVTKGGFLITHPSQVHAVSRRMPWKGGAHMREKSLSLGQHHCRDGSTRQGGVSSGARRQRTKANLSPSGSCPSLAQFHLCAPLLRPKEGLLALWFLAPGPPETQKNHLLLNHP
jgi:hypothetical protein